MIPHVEPAGQLKFDEADRKHNLIKASRFFILDLASRYGLVILMEEAL